jgi:hypothetical protein
VFESAIRLNLHIFCAEKTPVRKLLYVWPDFPLAILFHYDNAWETLDGPFDNLIAALEHRDRVRQIHITNPVGYLWEEIVTAMEGPNGSAPCLQDLSLREIVFPSFPRLCILSTCDNGHIPVCVTKARNPLHRF